MNRMSTPHFFRLLTFGTVLLSACAALGSTNHHVLLVTIDGLAAFYLDNPMAPLPTLRKLAREGSTARGMKVSSSQLRSSSQDSRSAISRDLRMSSA